MPVACHEYEQGSDVSPHRCFPVELLFQVLRPAALRCSKSEPLGEDEDMDELLQCFMGTKCKFKLFEGSTYAELIVAPPVNGNKVSNTSGTQGILYPLMFIHVAFQYPNAFFNEEEYGKRLIGNAVTVSVAEMLLRPLSKLFELEEYDDYPFEYNWPWPPPDPHFLDVDNAEELDELENLNHDDTHLERDDQGTGPETQAAVSAVQQETTAALTLGNDDHPCIFTWPKSLKTVWLN